MHKASFLEGTLLFSIQPVGPILIKSGESSGVDPTLPDMQFVRSQGQIYIPGPSLKGVIRAQAERICRSLDSAELQQARQQARSQQTNSPEPRIPLADNPLGTGTQYAGLEDMNYSSGRAIEDLKLESGSARTAIIYRRSSFVSQIFGHSSLAGRVRFADAMPTGELHTEERNGVAIDRIYGSVAVGPFNYEVVVKGNFQSRIDFKNLTLAQLGLLGLTLRDLSEGRIGIGFGKSRGLGRVSLTLQNLSIRYPSCMLNGDLKTITGSPICTSTQLAGLGAFCQDSSYQSYGLPAQDIAELPDSLQYTPDPFLGVEINATTVEQIQSIWKACMPAWRQEIGL